ncbi:MAG: hypothetical protein F7B95_00260 [Desulfurococcales archaeon]|nr:hypothetical protein [Desulfurococcales archaeon]
MAGLPLGEAGDREGAGEAQGENVVEKILSLIADKLGVTISGYDCWEAEALGLRLCIVSASLPRPLEPEAGRILGELATEASYGGRAAFLGLPSKLKWSPCIAAQAYLYALEDRFMGISRIRNWNLAVLSYIAGKTQLRDLLQVLDNISRIIIIIEGKAKALGCTNYVSVKCDQEELQVLSNVRLENL